MSHPSSTVPYPIEVFFAVCPRCLAIMRPFVSDSCYIRGRIVPEFIFSFPNAFSRTVLSERISCIKGVQRLLEKHASRRIVRRRLWFKALSTSELVADSPSAPSVGGAPEARLVSVSASGPGLEPWPADIVRRALFFLRKSRALVRLKGINPRH